MKTRLLVVASFSLGVMSAPVVADDTTAVVSHYADLAEAMYSDALSGAKSLRQAISALIAEPGEATLSAARKAWIEARVPYQQTEAFRFGNAIVDGWEGKVNAWPLDEGLIDYVDPHYGHSSKDNPLYAANVIGHQSIIFGGDTVDVSSIDKTLLTETLHEIGGVEANVATGYHAIEFLLWGQDLNGTGPGAGNRPWTDFAPGSACSNGNCERRAQYLAVATDLLIDELTWMSSQWSASGTARAELMGMDRNSALTSILTGLGSLSYGELAGERMKLGLMLNDPEEEHDCFSDNTHNSHYYNVVGMMSIYQGHHLRTDGSVLAGPALTDLVKATDPALDSEMRAKLDATHAAMKAIKTRAETVEAYDQMIGANNPEGNAALLAAIEALTDQTRSIERIVTALQLQSIAFEGSDSLDNPESVFQ